MAQYSIYPTTLKPCTFMKIEQTCTTSNFAFTTVSTGGYELLCSGWFMGTVMTNFGSPPLNMGSDLAGICLSVYISVSEIKYHHIISTDRLPWIADYDMTSFRIHAHTIVKGRTASHIIPCCYIIQGGWLADVTWTCIPRPSAAFLLILLQLWTRICWSQYVAILFCNAICRTGVLICFKRWYETTYCD